jgi:hypothetical protein
MNFAMRMFVIFFITATLLLGSCAKKAKDTSINGQVRTYGTEDPIQHPPVKVQLLEKHPPAGSFGAGSYYTTLTETYTDQDGYYTLSHKLYEDNDYYIAVDPETVTRSRGYYKPTFSFRDLPERRVTRIGGTSTVNYYLTAVGWVEFHLVSENPQPGDRYTYSVGGGGYEEFFGSVDEYRVWDFGGNMEHDVVYTTVRNGSYYPTREYFFVPAFDTLQYEVKFK